MNLLGEFLEDTEVTCSSQEGDVQDAKHLLDACRREAHCGAKSNFENFKAHIESNAFSFNGEEDYSGPPNLEAAEYIKAIIRWEELARASDITVIDARDPIPSPLPWRFYLNLSAITRRSLERARSQ